MAVDRKIIEEKNIQILDGIQADSKVQLDIQNRNHLGPEYQNDIGLWRNIIEQVRNFWSKRNSAECQHFDNDFSASCRHYDDSKRKFSPSMMFRKHLSGEVIKRKWLM
ncbi:zinc finger MYM-type protein 1 [Trichonephila clavata]|uniref:Zinc finger MYM-type protein 1 n=1 Tax=Trichonephila clavata TaxID=2740835 RepID=A0A8X6LC33_TRICU|nr:zinc finger MYM-type protein 1 [Trichonephila clavata]